jgi:hypothetical protein
LVVTYDLVEVQLSVNTGYIEGSVTFTNNARLIFFEFLRQTATEVEREKYRYHFMDGRNQLAFRYDNAPHHAEIATFPHHKHLPEGLAESAAPHFADIFAEIESYVLGIA